MSCLGVLFALKEEEIQKLKSYQTDGERLEYLQEEIEEVYFDDYPDYMAELDKSWDALHRSLTDGRCQYSNGEFPLSHVVLGGEILYHGDDYIMTLKTPEQVIKISEEVKKIDKEFLRNGYNKIEEKDYGFALTDEDFEYTLAYFEESREFWKLAAKKGRYVLFTADQ